MNFKQRETHFTGKRVAVYLMFRSLVIFRAIMNVNFLKLISVGWKSFYSVALDYFDEL